MEYNTFMGGGVDLLDECIARYKVPYEVTVVVPLHVLAHHGVWHDSRMADVPL